MKNVSEARTYLKEKTSFEGLSMADHVEGESNHNFVFEAEGEKYVLRVNRSSEGSRNRLEQERKILEFLEFKELGFAPKVIIQDPERELSVIEFVGDETVKLEDLDGDSQREWVEKLVEIHSLEFEEYRDFCRQKGYDCREPETEREGLERFGFSRFRFARERLERPELLEWVEKRLYELESLIEERGNSRIGLVHGDLAGNTRSGDRIYFIDWELARFTHFPAGELAYVFIHENLDGDVYRKIQKIYSDRADIQTGLQEELEKSERVTRVCDVIWALKRAAVLKENSRSGWKDYIELAGKRKQGFEKRFSSSDSTF